MHAIENVLTAAGTLSFNRAYHILFLDSWVEDSLETRRNCSRRVK